MKPEFFLNADEAEKNVALTLTWHGRNFGVAIFRSQTALEQFVTALQGAELIDGVDADRLLNLSQGYAWLPRTMAAAETDWFAANGHLAKVAEIKKFIAE